MFSTFFQVQPKSEKKPEEASNVIVRFETARTAQTDCSGITDFDPGTPTSGDTRFCRWFSSIRYWFGRAHSRSSRVYSLSQSASSTLPSSGFGPNANWTAQAGKHAAAATAAGKSYRNDFYRLKLERNSIIIAHINKFIKKTTKMISVNLILSQQIKLFCSHYLKSINADGLKHGHGEFAICQAMFENH